MGASHSDRYQLLSVQPHSSRIIIGEIKVFKRLQQHQRGAEIQFE